ncbi:hypothetical protein GCM10027343_40520 [Noviherbaspirillum agri]
MGKIQDPLLQPRSAQADELIFGARQKTVTISHFLANHRSTAFGYFGVPGEPAFGPPPSGMRHAAGFDAPVGARPGQGRNADSAAGNVFTVGYTWRDLTIERSAFSSSEAEDRQRRRNGDSLRLDSRSVRLSFNPSANWTVQVSRGSLNGLDHLVPNSDVRRTSISATHRQDFKGGNWQTTLAWGRNSRKRHETTTGYLVESTVRFEGTHVVFGRVEQVASDDLLREDESHPAKLFTLNKLTVGYFHDMRTGGPVKADVGFLASQHLVPASMTASYGNDPVSYMMFLRLKIR